jgi:plasmid stability protein
MPTLYARNIPAETMKKLKARASQEKRSVSAEVAIILEQSLQDVDLRSRRAKVLDEIREMHKTLPPLPEGVSTLEMLREDRAR